MAMRIEPTIIPKICGMMMTNPSASCRIESRATRKNMALVAAINTPMAMIVFAVRHISLRTGISPSVIRASRSVPYGLFSRPPNVEPNGSFGEWDNESVSPRLEVRH